MSLFNSVKSEIGVCAALWRRKKDITSIVAIIRFAFFIALCVFGLTGTSIAYTVVTTSTAAPAGLEQQFIANATNYMNAIYYKNPFAPNTYQLTLLGLNPQYIKPIDYTDSYTNGYANGTTDQVYREIGVNNGFFNNCASTGTWLAPGSTSTYITLDSTTTCVEVLNNIAYSMYQLLYGTYTPQGF